MKKLIVSIIFLSLTLACSSSTMKSDSPILYNRITTGIYVLDEENPGEYHKVVFKADGTIEGAVHLKLPEDIKWKLKTETSRSVDIYTSDSAEHLGEVYFPISSDYDGIYKPFLNDLNIMAFYINRDVKMKRVVYTDTDTINNIANKLNEFKKITHDRNTILSAVEKSNLFILDFSKEKKFEKLNSISQYKDLSYYRLFDEAYFNSKENSKVFNSTNLDDDEFVYREKKSLYEEVRNKKYLFIHSDSTYENLSLEFSEYDFEKKGYFCTIKKITPVGGLMGSGGFKIIEMVSTPFFIPINEKEAKGFKDHTLDFVILAERKVQMKKIKVTRIRINELGIKDVALDEEIWRQYQERYSENASKCYTADETIKQLNLDVIKYNIIDTDTRKVYTNIHQ